MDSEISIKAVNSAKRKRVEETMDMGQGEDRLPGTDRILNDIAFVPPILMAGLKSASYKISQLQSQLQNKASYKTNDRNLTGATLEME